MKKNVIFLAIAALAMFSASAFADTVTGAGTFQAWTSSNLNENGSPFWDNTSSDGANRNVGYYLSNTGFFTGRTDGPGFIPYYGIGTETASFSFIKTGIADEAALKIEIAGNSGINGFGWYSLANPSALNVIFSGSATGGATATFTPTASYGFYFNTVDGTFKTSDTGSEHFALFQGADSYWIGMEDLAFSHSDKDYNDMIVKVSSIPSVPEPATLLLLGVGLLGVAGIRRKVQN